jgi:hypothetical protein
MGLGISLVAESDTGADAEWRADNENPALKRFLRLLAERYPSPVGE